MEKIPQPAPQEMDPRKKESQGLDAWASKLLDAGIIGPKAFRDFIDQNNSKELQMEKRGLPQLRHYGTFGSAGEIREKLGDKPEERFIIRCASRATGEIKRLIDADLEEVCRFAEELPGGFSGWNVEVKEFAETIAAGTIVVTPSGKTSIESWHGGHYLNVGNVPKYHADFDPDQFDMHFKWKAPAGADDLADMQEHALDALRRLFPHLKPEEGKQVYVEYGVRKNGSVYFIEANDSSILVGK